MNISLEQLPFEGKEQDLFKKILLVGKIYMLRDLPFQESKN